MFVLALILVSLILRKAKAAYEFFRKQREVHHLLFMDDLKLYSRSEKGLDSLVQAVRAFRNGVWYRKICYVSNGERKDREVSWYRVAKW